MTGLKWIAIGVGVWLFGSIVAELILMAPPPPTSGVVGAVAGIIVGIVGYRKQKAVQQELKNSNQQGYPNE